VNRLLYLTILHIFNDGFEGSFLLLLPFIAKDLHINLAQVGMLGTAEGLMVIVCSIPAIYLAARYGGLRVLLGALFIYTAGFFLTALSPSFSLLFITFIVAGCGFGLFHSIAFGLVSRWSEKSERGRKLGNFTATGDAGKIALSSVLTFIIVIIGWRMTSLSFAFVTFILFVLFSKFITPKDQALEEKHVSQAHIPLKDFIKNMQFVLANTTNVFDSLASASLFIFLPFLLLKRGVNPAILGTFTATFFLGNFLGKTYLGRLVDKHGSAKIFIFSELFMAVFIFILANSSSILVILLSSVLLGAFTKGTVPVIKAMVSESVEHHENFEKAFGINSVIAGGASALAPIILGFVSNSYGIVYAFNLSAVFALIATAPALLYLLLRGGHKLVQNTL